jgi:hypothetical protein
MLSEEDIGKEMSRYMKHLVKKQLTSAMLTFVDEISTVFADRGTEIGNKAGMKFRRPFTSNAPANSDLAFFLAHTSCCRCPQ